MNSNTRLAAYPKMRIDFFNILKTEEIKWDQIVN